MLNIYRFIAAAGAAVCLAVGCVNEMSNPLITKDAVIELFQEPSPQTKSSVDGFTADAVNNLTVALFDKSTGMLADAFYFSPASSMKLPLVKGKTYAVYAVANVGDVSSVIRSSYANMTAFKSFPLSFASFAVVTAGGFPMASKAVSIVSGGASAAPVTLERLVAKYTVNIDRSALASGSTLTVKSMNIRQAALSARPFADASERKAGTVSDGDYAVTSDITALNGGGAITLYLLENRQGALLPSNTDQKNKIPATPAQRNVCTYLEMVCAYAKTDKRADNVTYRIYLGEDNITDFSIVRNCVYTLTLKPTDAGIDQPSWQIDPGDILTWSHSLSVAPSDPVIKVAGTQAFTATYTTRKYVNGHEEVSAMTSDDVTSSATWTSQNTSVATLSSATATGVAAGSSYIKASYNGYEAGSTLTVEEVRIFSASDITIDEFSYSPETIDASGGTSTPTVKYSQTVIYESGIQERLTQDKVTAELNFTGEAEGFSVIPQTGVVTATKNTDIERSVDVVVTVALNGKLTTARATVKQESKLIRVYGGQSGSNFNIFANPKIPYGYSVDVEFEVAYPKSGGGNGIFPKTYTRTIPGNSVSPIQQFATSHIETPYPSDMASLTITGGRIVGVSPTTVGEYTVKFEAGDFIKSYDNPIITIGNSHTLTVAKNGNVNYNLKNEFSISASQKERWNSGKTTEYTSVAMSFYGSNSDFTIDSNTGVLTTKYNDTGEERSIDITVVATANGKTSSKTFTVYQSY